ncbi:50S small subunit ribosomal protein L1 [Cryptococcus wingfieldii CBS 7118]|uniref:Ribosomal protein n=1 Tax=Cryptococcus wingfieldii CBS 7118 TaxID=1295528 RepID=A0A1E3JFD4_9TREE|nr:50S small subunit ribosomal protein L1 [Cryptococcus wingfieldii CBS 7118]ODN99552.1 50S small subunit ribosomal protein L1 [Cryptococcus wingfieldii CBS 7118]
MPPQPPFSPDDYFLHQAKLFSHLEKRHNKFAAKTVTEAQRARDNRKHPPPKKVSPPAGNMIGSSSIRGSARAISQAARPSLTPAPSASFSTTAPASIRVAKNKLRKVGNPDALPAEEATKILRALEVAHPKSTYTLTLTTKSHKSALPIRGSFNLPLDPRRTSETILVFAEPSSSSAAMAKEAGAAYVGGDELFEALLSGKINPTRCLATPGMMPTVTRSLARFLGPKGLMPAAKRGGVAEGEELVERIRDAAGKMEYRADKAGTVRINVARLDFGVPAVEQNVKAFIKTVRDNQAAANQTDDPLAAAAKKNKKKGSQITAAILESTNGPSIELNDVL